MYLNTQYTDPNTIQAVIFDCDGTLVDSEYAHFLGYHHALTSVGSGLMLNEYYQYVGNSAKVICQM